MVVLRVMVTVMRVLLLRNVMLMLSSVVLTLLILVRRLFWSSCRAVGRLVRFVIMYRVSIRRWILLLLLCVKVLWCVRLSVVSLVRLRV